MTEMLADLTSDELWTIKLEIERELLRRWEPDLCADCGIDTTPCIHRRGCRHKGRWEWYMVHDEVWAAAGMDEGYLCVGCLEARLGRSLTAADFTTAPINEPDSWDTPRLAAARLR